MAVVVVGFAIETDQHNVSAKRRRLSLARPDEVDREVRKAKQTIGLCVRARIFPGRLPPPASCIRAAETLEAAGVTKVLSSDVDL